MHVLEHIIYQLLQYGRKIIFTIKVHVKQSRQLEHIYLHGRMLTYRFFNLLLSISEVSAEFFGLRAFRSSYSRAKWRLLSLCFSATLSESSFNFIGLKKNKQFSMTKNSNQRWRWWCMLHIYLSIEKLIVILF